MSHDFPRSMMSRAAKMRGSAAAERDSSPARQMNNRAQQQAVLTGSVAILWDMENCPVPSEVKADDVAGNIRMALRTHPVIQGSVTFFSAYGDFNHFPRKVREGCQRTGVNLIDVPNGKKDASDKAILVDMFLFALDNSPPCTIFLISGDVDFAPALHKLGQRGYTVVLAIPSGVGVSSALCSAGRFVWDWPSVARGGGLVPAKNSSSRSSVDERMAEMTLRNSVDERISEMNLRNSVDERISEMNLRNSVDERMAEIIEMNASAEQPGPAWSQEDDSDLPGDDPIPYEEEKIVWRPPATSRTVDLAVLDGSSSSRLDAAQQRSSGLSSVQSGSRKSPQKGLYAPASKDQRSSSPYVGASKDQRSSSPYVGASKDQRSSSPYVGASKDQRSSSPYVGASKDQRSSSPYVSASIDQRSSAPYVGASKDQRSSSPYIGSSKDQRSSSPYVGRETIAAGRAQGDATGSSIAIGSSKNSLVSPENLQALREQLVRLLSLNGSKMELSRVPGEYQKQYGKPLFPGEYAHMGTKLANLLERLREWLFMRGEGATRTLHLTKTGSRVAAKLKRDANKNRGAPREEVVDVYLMRVEEAGDVDDETAEEVIVGSAMKGKQTLIPEVQSVLLADKDIRKAQKGEGEHKEELEELHVPNYDWGFGSGGSGGSGDEKVNNLQEEKDVEVDESTVEEIVKFKGNQRAAGLDILGMFRLELQELLVSYAWKIKMKAFVNLYEQRYSKVLDYEKFGVKDLESLIEKVGDVAVIMEGSYVAAHRIHDGRISKKTGRSGVPLESES